MSCHCFLTMFLSSFLLYIYSHCVFSFMLMKLLNNAMMSFGIHLQLHSFYNPYLCSSYFCQSDMFEYNFQSCVSFGEVHDFPDGGGDIMGIPYC